MNSDSSSQRSIELNWNCRVRASRVAAPVGVVSELAWKVAMACAIRFAGRGVSPISIRSPGVSRA